ncbi:MAG: hypothetical protein R3E01_26210 [Pirellulaceae bacterium]|nr:hypothetical protein [Planctomycetales bacterium]
MARRVAVLIAILYLTGCRAPRPSYDPFAVYGPKVVPPPATGTLGQPNSYYQPPPANTVPVPTVPPAGQVPLTVPSLGQYPPPAASSPQYLSSNDWTAPGSSAQSAANVSLAGDLDRTGQIGAATSLSHLAAEAQRRDAVVSPGVSGLREASDLRWNSPGGIHASVAAPRPFTPPAEVRELTDLPLPRPVRPSTVRPSGAYSAASQSVAPVPVAPDQVAPIPATQAATPYVASSHVPQQVLVPGPVVTGPMVPYGIVPMEAVAGTEMGCCDPVVDGVVATASFPYIGSAPVGTSVVRGQSEVIHASGWTSR